MIKTTLLLFCLSILQISFAQTENLNVEGAIIISTSESPNPVEGTIRWTGQDFEGFDGTIWKSLTSCDSDLESTEAQINCPAQNFVLTDCNLLVNWTHQNPESSTVNYDTRINGIDPALSVAYPVNSTSFNICTIL